jgi:hypothetical protein
VTLLLLDSLLWLNYDQATKHDNQYRRKEHAANPNQRPRSVSPSGGFMPFLLKKKKLKNFF